MMMQLFKSLKLGQILRYCFALLLGLGFMLTAVLGSASAVQAASNTSSAASANDAARINQRKEEAPHYLNWYEDQRSLESYMEDAGVNGPTERNFKANSQNDAQLKDRNLLDRSKQGFKGVADNLQGKIQQGLSNTAGDPRDRVYRDVPEWYQDMENDAGNEPKLRNTPDNVGRLVPGSSKTTYKANYRDTQDYGAANNDVRQRVGNAIDSAKETFQNATEKAASGNNPLSR